VQHELERSSGLVTGFPNGLAAGNAEAEIFLGCGVVNGKGGGPSC